MRFRLPNLCRALLALLLTAHIALATVMAVWHPLHAELHECCDHHHEQTHPCEVTLFAQGTVPLVTPPTALSAPQEMHLAEEFSGLRWWQFTPLAGHLIGGVLAHSPPRGP